MATVIIRGSDGSITIDETGRILKRQTLETPYDDDDTVYPDIDRFDVEEYRQHYDVLDDTDILLIGYWTKDGEYEPPEADHRKFVHAEFRLSELAGLSTVTEYLLAEDVELMRLIYSGADNETCLEHINNNY